MIHGMLHIFRKGTGHSPYIHLICVKAFRLDKYLMSVLIGEFNYFILNGRTIAGSGSLYHSGIQRRTIQVISYDFMCFFICIGQPAGLLLNLYRFRICGKRKRYYSLISKLLLHFGKINCSFIDSRRCSCFKSKHLNPIFF